MKIAFISDTHHSNRALELIIKKLKELNVDKIIHLGDYASDIKVIETSFKNEVYAVLGNCDSFNQYPKEALLNVNGKKIFFTHGDLYNVKETLNSLFYKGLSLGADIILFGHTHISIKENLNNILIMNPGSISKPHPLSKIGSIGILEIALDGRIVKSELIPIKMY